MKDLHHLKRNFVTVFIPILFLLLYGYTIGAFRDFPKGVDAYAHLSMIKFVLDNWPHIRWNPYWYGGLSYYLIYAPLPHLLTAAVVKITGWPIELTMLFLEATALVIMIIGLFLLINEVTRNPYVFLSSTFMLISSPVFWGLIVSGGAYARILSLMWLPLSAYFVLKWNQHPRRINYLLAVLITSIGFSSHLQVGLFIIANAIFLTYFYHSSEKVSIRLKWVFKITIPSFLLSAYFYIPFIFSKPSQFFGKPHVPGPINITTVLSQDNWNVIPFYILIFGAIAFLLKYKRGGAPDILVRISPVIKSIQIILLLLFIYAFTSLIPPELYVFSPYDAPFYIVLYLSVLIGLLLAQIRGKSIIKVSTIFFLLFLFLTSLVQYPIILKHVWNSGVESWYSGYYVSQQLVKLPNETNFRFGADWDGATSWFNYKYTIPQVLGYYDINIAPRSYWNQLLIDTVWKNEGELSLTNYLIDWNAIKWIMVGFPYYNYRKFLNEPNYYKVISKVDTPTMYTMYLFEYNNASPIVSATNAVTIGVLSDEEYYKNFFLLLSLSSYNSKNIIPIRLEEDKIYLRQWKDLDIILLHPNEQQLKDNMLWESLADYVREGGALIIDGNNIKANYPIPSPIKESNVFLTSIDKWNFTFIDKEVLKYVDILALPLSNFSFTTLDKIREGSRVLLENNGLPIIVEAQYNNGRVIWFGLDIVRTGWQEKSYSASQLLIKLIEQATRIQLKEMEKFQLYSVENMDAIKYWSVSWTTVNASGKINFNKTTTELIYIFKDEKHDDQVNYLYDPPGSWNLSNQEYLYIRLFGDGSGHKITVYLQNDDYRDSFWFDFNLDWVGWREIVYPISEMKKYGQPNIKAINKIEIVINDQFDAFGDGKPHSFYLNEISTITYKDIIDKLEYSVKRLNPEIVIIDLAKPARGVLFKETYFDRWSASVVKNGAKKQELTIYRAGPDFMYVRIPKEVKFPIKVVFEYKISVVDWLGYISSLLTLASLFLYGLGLSHHVLYKKALELGGRRQAERRKRS
jgi:hypothetical protein